MQHTKEVISSVSLHGPLLTSHHSSLHLMLRHDKEVVILTIAPVSRQIKLYYTNQFHVVLFSGYRVIFKSVFLSNSMYSATSRLAQGKTFLFVIRHTLNAKKGQMSPLTSRRFIQSMVTCQDLYSFTLYCRYRTMWIMQLIV